MSEKVIPYNKEIESPYLNFIAEYEFMCDKSLIRMEYYNDINNFIRMIKLAGKTKFDNWFKAHYTYTTNFNELWFTLQKSLRQGDFFDLTITVRLDKDVDIETEYINADKIGEFKNGDNNISIKHNGHFDMILRNILQTEGVYDFCKQVLTEEL